jgi:hypothetical protein
VVIMLAIGPKVRWFRPGLGRWAFKGNKIRSTTSFGGEVKPAVLRRKILRHVKDPYGMKEIRVGIIQVHFSPNSTALLLAACAGYC